MESFTNKRELKQLKSLLQFTIFLSFFCYIANLTRNETFYNRKISEPKPLRLTLIISIPLKLKSNIQIIAFCRYFKLLLWHPQASICKLSWKREAFTKNLIALPIEVRSMALNWEGHCTIELMGSIICFPIKCGQHVNNSQIQSNYPL